MKNRNQCIILMSLLRLCNHRKATVGLGSDGLGHRCHQFRPNYTVSTDHSHHKMGSIMMTQESQKRHGVDSFPHSPEVMHSIASKMVLNENHSLILYH